MSKKSYPKINLVPSQNLIIKIIKEMEGKSESEAKTAIKRRNSGS